MVTLGNWNDWDQRQDAMGWFLWWRQRSGQKSKNPTCNLCTPDPPL